MQRHALVVVLASIAFSSSCEGPAPKQKIDFFLDEVLEPGQVRCGPLRRDSELIGGPGAYGQVGRGFRCNNAQIRFIVQDASRPVATSTRGGTLIDVDLARAADAPGADTFREQVSAIGALETLVDSIEVLNDGTNGEPGVIRVSGTPADLSLAPQAYFLAQPLEGRFITDYVLHKDVPWIEVITTFENAGPPGIEVQAADFIALGGATKSFTEGFGFESVPLFADVGFLAGGRGERVSYAWLCDGEDVIVPFIDQGTTAPFCGTGNPVGSARSFVRYLVVGDGSLESVTRPALELRGLTYGVVRGVVQQPDGSPAAGVVVSALSRPLAEDGARVRNEARTDARGAFELSLRAGNYQLLAHTSGQGRSDELAVEVADGGEADVGALTLGGRAELVVTTRFFGIDGTELPPRPAKLTLIPTGDTQRPSEVLVDFRIGGASAYRVSTDGRFRVAAAPGTYEAWVSHGFEWERFSIALELRDGVTSTVEARLQRAFETPGLIAAEMHQHTLGSIDAEVPVALKVLENAAEGVEIAVSTDHDNIVDFAPHVQALGLSAFVRAFPGNEVSYQAIGHFNVYPWTIDAADPYRDVGSTAWWSKTVPQMFDDARVAAGGDPIVQINHPRSERTGYFASLLLDPSDASRFPRDPPELPALPADVYSAWSGDFDAVEVNGSLGSAALFTDEAAPELKRRARDEGTTLPTLADYFALLGAGMKIVAVGNSDTHVENEGVGYPRNFLFVGTDDPNEVDEARFKEAIRKQRVAVGEGCLLTLEVDGAPRMGMDELVAPDAAVTLRLRAPSYASVARLEVYVNGRVQKLLLNDGSVRIDGAGEISLPLVDPPAPRPSARLDAPLFGLPSDRDLAVVVLARDGDGLAPTGAGGVFCYAPPLYIDSDGDGSWTPWLEATQQVRP